MVLNSPVAFGSVGDIGGGVAFGLQIQKKPWSRGVPSFWSFLSVRVVSVGCATGVRRSGFSSSAGGVRMNAAAGADDSSIKSVSVRIHGKVQGVFYRNWTVDTAKQLGVNGWVRNNKDGTVEAVFSGKASAVDTLIENCKFGPSAAKVRSVEATPYKDTVADGFERRPTIW